MFTEKRVVFYHCVSPVHMGSGTALGVIDNPIQREIHNGHPVFAGSGIKGALRHHFTGLGADPKHLNAIFGPESNYASDHAGAVSFTDAQLLLLPVRSARQGFVYVTSPTALANARRAMTLCGEKMSWSVPDPPKEGTALVASREHILKDGKLALELFEFSANEDPKAVAVARALAERMPPDWEFFRKKLATDFAILSDTDFGFFTRNSVLVEPHVSINDETGAADGGKLFYTENLPPESVLIGIQLCSKTRLPKDKNGQRFELSAESVAALLSQGLPAGGMDPVQHQLLQIGGDATTGRGQVVLSLAAQEARQ